MILRQLFGRQRHPLLGASSSLCHPPNSWKYTSRSPLFQSRWAHAVPSLGIHDAEFSTNGIGELFSPPAFQMAWTDYQRHMVDKLNLALADDAVRSSMDVKTLLQNTAREPSLAPMFNYASMAHNNFFFFRTLSPTKTEMPANLASNLIGSFSSIETLRTSFISTAAAMFGPGFVWLVQTENQSPNHPAVASNSSARTGIEPSQIHFRILVTYLAGSPYPQAHMRQQSQDMNTQNLQSVEEYNRQTRPQNSVGSFGNHNTGARGMAGIDSPFNPYSSDAKRYGAADCIPVLCVNTWEHCYMHDFGVDGKWDYLQTWWDAIDWNIVWSLCMKKETFRFRR